MLGGVVLIVWGYLRARKRIEKEVVFPIIDFNNERSRKRLALLVLLLPIGATLVAAGSFQAIHFMESNTFCGKVCHTVMTPEYTAYQRSPHARVDCVQCHVGTGADWFVKSKLSGAWQLVAVAFDIYDRPISTPVHNLRPSKGTCEQCHWPAKFHGTPPKMITRFAEDETNTETKTILLMNIGGHDFAESHGIHWHMDPDVLIRYRSDPSRETIYEVELTREDGSVERFHAEGLEASGETEWRTMDCIDCHNRPTHIFYEAETGVDLMLERGFIAKDLPYVKREGVRAIRAGYASHDEALPAIAETVSAFYRDEYPELASSRASEIEQAGRVLGSLYKSNVHPDMKLDWGTYPDHIGHEQSPGCFRCHGGNHSDSDGETITMDCRSCHTIVAYDEASPQILELIPD